MVQQELVQLLLQQKMTLATAESLTGGLVATTICQVPGASAVFLEGIVSYSVESKILRLGVLRQSLQEFSPVSPQVALQMAIGIRSGLDTDFGLSTTGVAGPDTQDDWGNPKGLFYIAVATRENSWVYRFMEKGSREEIRQKASAKALEIALALAKQLTGDHENLTYQEFLLNEQDWIK